MYEFFLSLSMEEEVYKPSPNFQLLVSNYGNIKDEQGKKRIVNKTGKYIRIGGKSRNGTKHTISVHRLVAETFINLIPENYVVNHKDGNKHNNYYKNLEIVTYKENSKHALDTGLRKSKRGEETWNCQNTEEDIIKICKMIKVGNTNVFIANKFNISEKHIHSIRVGHRWKHLFKDNLGEIFKAPAIQGNIEDCFKVIDFIKNNTHLKNSEISKALNIEASMISRIRHKKCWHDVYNYYDRRATTIEKASRDVTE